MSRSAPWSATAAYPEFGLRVRHLLHCRACAKSTEVVDYLRLLEERPMVRRVLEELAADYLAELRHRRRHRRIPNLTEFALLLALEEETLMLGVWLGQMELAALPPPCPTWVHRQEGRRTRRQPRPGPRDAQSQPPSL